MPVALHPSIKGAPQPCLKSTGHQSIIPNQGGQRGWTTKLAEGGIFGILEETEEQEVLSDMFPYRRKQLGNASHSIPTNTFYGIGSSRGPSGPKGQRLSNPALRGASGSPGHTIPSPAPQMPYKPRGQLWDSG